MGAAICFSIYKLFDKRKKRAPEGDVSGRSHIWGAVAITVFGLMLGSLVSQHLSLPGNPIRQSLACRCSQNGCSMQTQAPL